MNLFRSTTWAILLMQPYNNKNITLAMTNSTKAMTESSAAAVFDEYSRPFGLTYGDWTAKWWQWGLPDHLACQTKIALKIHLWCRDSKTLL